MKFIFVLLFLFCVNKSTFSNKLDREIENFILNNPEVILKSLENYEIKREKKENDEVKEKVKSLNTLIYDHSNGLYTGKKNSKISIVKFSDYNCSYCKKAHKDILKIKKDFPNVKIIYKNFPILSPLSEKLARISYFIAKNDNKKFNIFNDKLLQNSGLLNENKIKKILIDLDYDSKEIENEIKKDYITNLLNKDLELAKSLKFKRDSCFHYQ